MYSRSAATAYKTVDLESAPKTQIVERLYERFARDVEEARMAIGSKDIHGKARALDHAIRIATELRAALDHAAAPALCANLDALYEFVIGRLSECNSSLQTKPLDQAAKIMAELGDAFRIAHTRAR
ncbi:MAG: flagellar export chaperone FliS [Kofleriaceae bacterium]